MTRPDRPASTEQPFLSVDDAEIVHGPEVIAEKVAGALGDADRFGLPKVKPPLSEALEEIERSGGPAEPEPAGQDALAVKPADIDERAGSAEMLRSDGDHPS